MVKYTQEKIRKTRKSLFLCQNKIVSLNHNKIKNMSIAFITGWSLMLLSWAPKPFIKNERKQAGLNLGLSGIALGIFIADLIYRLW